MLLRRRKQLSATILVACAALIAAACSSSPASPSGSGGNSIVKLSFAYAAPIPLFAPEMIIADHPSFCAKYGVDPVISDLSSALIGPALVADHVQMEVTGVGSFVISSANSPGSQIAVGAVGPAPYEEYGSPDTKSISAVRGQTVGATSQGSTTDLVNRAVLGAEGIVVGKDTKVAYANNGPAMYALATHNSIAFFTSPPPLPNAISQAGVHAIGVVPTSATITPLVVEPVVANKSFYTQHQKAVTGMLNCIAAANKYALANPAPTISQIEKNYQADQATSTAGYDASKPAYQLFPITASGLDVVKAALAADGLDASTLGSLNVSSIIDTKTIKGISGALQAPPY
jgi:ABC-type nitrate/sulfonate/bicarbonate transport system substrate-binding protein